MLFFHLLFSHSVVSDSATLWTPACQASLSFTICQSLLKLMFIELVVLSNRIILCRPPLLLPSAFSSIGVFYNASALHISWSKYWSFSISPSKNIQAWFPLGLTGLISLLSRGLSKSLIQHHNSKASVLWHSRLYGSTLISIHDFWKNHNFDYTDLCWQSDVSDTFGDRLPIGTSKHCIRGVPLVVGVPTHTSFMVKI